MIYATLASKNPGDTARVLQACLAAQIRQMRDTLSGANIPISTEGLQHADIIPIPTSKPIKLLTDERIGDPTAGLSPTLAALPYAHKPTLPSTAPVAIALLALASRQAEWVANMAIAVEPKDLSPSDIQQLETQIPMLTRCNPTPPTAASIPSTLTCTAFRKDRKSPEYCIRLFQEAALHTFKTYISAPQHSHTCEKATSHSKLPPNVQALLQILDATQPADSSTLRYTAQNTVEYRATLLPTNPIQLQSMPINIRLKHPTIGSLEFSFSPPGSKSILLGNEAWTNYHRSTILVQSELLFPWPDADLKDGKIPQSHPLYAAMIMAFHQKDHLRQTLDPENSVAFDDLLELAYAPNETIITSHPRRPDSAMMTNFNISPNHHLAYCLLATLDGPVTVETDTYSQHRGAARRVCLPISFHPAPRSVLGRHYYPIITHPNVQDQARLVVAESRRTLDLRPLLLKRDNSGKVTGLQANATQQARWAHRLLTNSGVLIPGEYEASNMVQAKRKGTQRARRARASKHARPNNTQPPRVPLQKP